MKMMFVMGKVNIFILLLFCLFAGFTSSHAQEVVPSYPKMAGYFSAVHVIVTASKDETVTNFSPAYTVGFPTGVNILKNDHIGFSFELTPFVKVENNSSKMSNLLFHPGIIFRRKNGFAITERMAFETSGRFGTTTVFTKIIKHHNGFNSFVAAPFPLRFGNDKSMSIGVAIQIGISF
jgi:hypothetical protein